MIGSSDAIFLRVIIVPIPSAMTILGDNNIWHSNLGLLEPGVYTIGFYHRLTFTNKRISQILSEKSIVIYE
jgi:hypothetical protein